MPHKKSQSSFIPQKKGSYRLSRRKKFGRSLNLTAMSGALLFLLVLTAWTGLVLYQRYIEDQIEVKERALVQATERLDQEVVDHLIEADKQFSASAELLNRHIAPSVIFTLLEDLTVEDLRYTSFSYQGAPTEEASVMLEGEAHNFSTVVTQADVLERSEMISRTTYSDLDKEAGGITGDTNVSFTLELTLSPDVFSYSEVYETEQIAGGDQENSFFNNE